MLIIITHTIKTQTLTITHMIKQNNKRASICIVIHYMLQNKSKDVY